MHGLCLFTYSGVQHILCFSFVFLRSCVPYVASFSGLFLFCFSSFLCTLCCQLLWIVFVLFFFVLVYPMLPVSLDCFCFVFLRSCVPYVASFSGLFLFCFSSFLCTLCCQFLWIVFVLFFFVLVYPMLPVSLDCFCFVFLRSCVPYVASFSGLFLFCFSSFLCTLCCQFLWIVFVLFFFVLVYPMLPASLDCFCFVFLRSCVPYVASFSGLFLFCFSSFLCTLCCQLLWIVFVLFFFVLVYPMLPVSLDCFCFVFLRSCVPYVASFSGLFLFCFSSFLCTLCCQLLRIVFVLFFFVLVYPMLPVSLDCFCFVFLRSCVPYVASFSGLFLFCFSSFLCTLCCQFLWIVFVLFFFVLVYSMLPASLGCVCY